MGVGVADSAFVCDEAFVNNSITDILSVARVFLRIQLRVVSCRFC